MYTDEFIQVNGIKLHYQDWGNSDASPLLFIHGLTQQSHTFDVVAQRLRKKYHCLSIDLRGRGDSEWASKETYNVISYAEDVCQFLDALNIKKTHLVGTSLGGLIAMTLGTMQPERILSVVINDIGPVICGEGLARIGRAAAARKGAYQSVEEYLDESMLGYAPHLNNRSREELMEMARWRLRKNEDGTFRVHYDPAINQGSTNTDQEGLRKTAEFMWKGFKAFKCPILVVRGGISDLLEPATVEAMRVEQPAMKFVEVPGVNHAPELDEPTSVEALGAFFSLNGG